MDHGGCQGTFDVFPGTAEKSIGKIDDVSWDKPPEKPGIQEAMFTIIGDMGMTGQLIRLNSYQWAAITEAKIEKFFYASWFKVLEDAQMMTKKK